MSWIKKLFPQKIRTAKHQRNGGIPEGLWTKCLSCQAILYRADLERNLGVCPKCHHHERISARQHLKYFLDPEGQQVLAEDISTEDRLKFKDTKRYKDRLSEAQKKTGETEALIVIQGQLYRMPVIAAAFEFGFMGGSMGAAVGNRFVAAVQASLRHQAPLVCFTASGGARMQEALFSLMQMAKTSAALGRLREQAIPYITILTDPTMGGVSASLAMLGDIIIAEPKALIGFAGPRVIEQTVHETLPDGFQRSEFLLAHGAIDMIVDRRQMRQTVAQLLAKLTHQAPLAEPQN